MSNDGDVDKAKGRVKEAAGTLTGDKSLKNEGRVDRDPGERPVVLVLVQVSPSSR